MRILYRHTQIAWAVLIPADITCIFMIYAFAAHREYGALFALVALSVLSALFYALTVTVTESDIDIKFGIGLLRKRVPRGDVFLAEPHRTSFCDGWGIRGRTAGRIYNVSGYEAVRLTLHNGRRIIIGTDDPARLLAAIQGH